MTSSNLNQSSYEEKRDAILENHMLYCNGYSKGASTPETSLAIDSLIQQERLRAKIGVLKELLNDRRDHIRDFYRQDIEKRIADLQKQLDEYTDKSEEK